LSVLSELLGEPIVRSLAVAAAALAVLAAGCSSGSQSPAASSTTGTTGSPSPTATASGSPTPGDTSTTSASPTATGGNAVDVGNVKVIAVAVAGGKVIPPPSRVKVRKGQTVKIVVITDTADEVHVHGYDKEAETTAGSPTTIEFAATQTGLFEVETHKSKKVLFSLQVQ